jgi:hypothetical protein
MKGFPISISPVAGWGTLRSYCPATGIIPSPSLFGPGLKVVPAAPYKPENIISSVKVGSPTSKHSLTPHNLSSSHPSSSQTSNLSPCINPFILLNPNPSPQASSSNLSPMEVSELTQMVSTQSQEHVIFDSPNPSFQYSLSCHSKISHLLSNTRNSRPSPSLPSGALMVHHASPTLEVLTTPPLLIPTTS